MRKHSVRKWIHAILDLLPLLVIPIFAINIINRSVEPLSVEYGDIHTEVNYKYETNDVNTLNDLIEGNIYFADNLQFAYDDYSDVDIYLLLLSYDSISVDGTSYIEEVIFNDDSYNSLEDNYIFFNYFGESSFHLTNGNTYVSYNYEDSTIAITNVNFLILDGLEDFKFYISTFVDSNITSSDFNVIESVEEVHDTVIYNDTDIGSQFVYSLYHVTDKYFNMNDTFNLGQVYEWFTNNIFGGNPPLAVPIVWNVIIYEFIMDLLFLLYAVFMFIIDFADSFIERMFDKSRCGGR